MNEQVVILKEKLAERYLPIYIGSPQAVAIKQALMGTPIGVHQTKLPIDI